jgi:hypothetical protein
MRALDFEEYETVHDRIIMKLERFGPEELEMIEILVDRLEMGQTMFGEWTPSTDERNNFQEALEEGVDLMHYLCAELVRMRNEG